MALESACLGLHILGTCNYDPSNPQRAYFTIGQLISVLALFLAFSQLTKPIFKFRLRAHKINHKVIYCIFGAAIVSVFLAAILPFIPGQALPLVGYPVFWEITSGVLIVFATVTLMLAMYKRPIFRKRNAESYLYACAAIIARGNENDLGELAEDILPSIKPIINECAKYNVLEKRLAEAEGKHYPIEEVTKIAFTVLNLWSDKLLSKNIICKMPTTASRIFQEIENNMASHCGYSLIQELIHQAFINADSILMREEDYSGLGFFKEFRDLAFSNWQFVKSNYRPLQAWQYYRSNIEPFQVKKYLECLEVAFNAYFKAEEWYDTAPLSVAIDQLVRLADSQVVHIGEMDERELHQTRELEILNEIGQGFEEIIHVVGKNRDIIPSYSFDESSYDHTKDDSIYGVVALGIYEFFESLARIGHHDEALRFYAIRVWLKVFAPASSISQINEEIGKRLIFHLKQKVIENLDPAQRGYPAITRLLITLLGISEPAVPSDGGIENTFQKYFIDRLKYDYPKLVESYPDYAKDLLPEDFIYDKTSNEIRHTRKSKRKTQVVILKCGIR